MGVVTKSTSSSKNLSKGFLASQSHWGHSKQILNQVTIKLLYLIILIKII
jgi:hypothetical protein